MSRIIGRKEDISYNSVEDFFEQRGNSTLLHKYNYVMYLDEHPEIAIERDKQAKKKIESLLNIGKGMNILDLGCGVGRWGELFCGKGAFYVGVDGSKQMIKRAEENLGGYENKKLLVGNLREIDKISREVAAEGQVKFDIIFFCGVLMYLNDNDMSEILRMLPQLLKRGGHICFVESLSEEKRLTLKDIFSEDLKQNYSAIYRTADEFNKLVSNSLGKTFKLKKDELMDFSDGLQKKREHVTLEHCIIWEADK